VSGTPGRPVGLSMLGIVENAELGTEPYRVDADGQPYLPVGDGGVVLGLDLGDPVFSRTADHAAPGACIVHPDPVARHGLTTYCCVGNTAVVRTGDAAGAEGVVIGKRGERGRVIVALGQDDLARLRPGDEVAVHAVGQGWRPAHLSPDVSVMNADPGLLSRLPVSVAEDGSGISAHVRACVPGRLAGNGIGRPAVSWDLDLQLRPADLGEAALLLGDLIAVTDIDARYTMGYRRGWVTVGVVSHGASRLPGHGPGMTPLLTGPADVLRAHADAVGHGGLGWAAGQPH